MIISIERRSMYFLYHVYIISSWLTTTRVVSSRDVPVPRRSLSTKLRPFIVRSSTPCHANQCLFYYPGHAASRQDSPNHIKFNKIVAWLLKLVELYKPLSRQVGIHFWCFWFDIICMICMEIMVITCINAFLRWGIMALCSLNILLILF